MKVLIMGCGRVGAMVATQLAEEGHEVTIMDPNPESFRRLPQNTGVVALAGDGTDHEVLRRAGIESMDVFVAVSNRDTLNALAAQIARFTFHTPRVVCRLNDPTRQEIYQELGLEAVSPTQLVSQMILDAIHR
ncbi:MAG: TrkA family potassium uptake protein [Chloroflexi bacterium]|nr:TrkA family potassium uptake protein [Chloroflexota bacterium]